MQRNLFYALLICLCSATAALAERGPVTNLPIPRFVSLKASEGNVRRGPSLSHRIDWIYKHRGMPLRVTAEHGHWRRVEDRDGAGGWVHYSLISGARTGLVEDHMAPIHLKADPNSGVAAYVEAGVIARLGQCDPIWCRVTVKDHDGRSHKGWMDRDKIWGLMPGELRD